LTGLGIISFSRTILFQRSNLVAFAEKVTKSSGLLGFWAKSIVWYSKKKHKITQKMDKVEKATES
jgi:hypothetical protein